MFRLRLLVCLCALAAAADNPFLYRYGPDGLRISLVDQLRDAHYSWPRSLLSYPVDFADFAGDEADLRLFTGDGAPQQFQLTDQRYDAKGGLRFAILHLMADLPTGARRDFHLATRPSAPAVTEPTIGISELADASIVIDTGPLRIRMPDSKHDRILPLLQLERDEGWLGASQYRSEARPSHINVEQLHSGPLIAEFAITVSFSDGGVHHTRLRAIQGYEHFELHETIAGFADSPDSRWEFRWLGGPPGSMRPASVGATRPCWQLTQDAPTETIAVFAIGEGLPVRVGEIRGTLAFAFPLQNGQRHCAIAFGAPRPHCWHQQHYGDLPLNHYKDWRLAAPNPASTFELFQTYRATSGPRIQPDVASRIAAIASAMPEHPMSGEWLDRLRREPNIAIDFGDCWPAWALVPAARRYLQALSAPIDGVRQRPLPAPPIDQLARVAPILAEHLAYIDDPSAGTRPPLPSAIIPGHGLVLRGAPNTDREVSLFVPEADAEATLVRFGTTRSLPLSGRASLVAELGSLHYGRIGDHQLILVDADYLDLGAQRLYTSDAAPRSHDQRIGSGIVRDYFDGHSELAVFGGGAIDTHGIHLSTSPGLSASLHATRDRITGGQFFARRHARATFEAAPGADLSSLRFIVDGQALPLEMTDFAASVGLPRGHHRWRIAFANSASSYALRIEPPPGTPPRLHELLVRAENTWLREDSQTVITPGPAYGECVSDSGGTMHLRFSPPANRPASPLKLVAHWPMDAGSGDIAADVVGEANAALVGMNDEAWRKQPKGGYALAFDGEGQQLLSNLQLSLLKDCSIGLWFNSIVSGALLSREVGLSSGIGLSLKTDGAVVGRVLGAELRSPLGYNDGKWHHVVLTLRYQDDECQARLYIDGNAVDLRVTPRVSGDDRQDPLRLGCSPPFGSDANPPRCYHGHMDDVRVYAGTLGPEDVAAWTRSGSGFSPPILLLPSIDHAPPGQPYRRELRAMAMPEVSIDVSGLPVWLDFDPLSSSLYGTPPEVAIGSETTLTVRATNSEGQDEAQFVVRVPGPVVVPSGLRLYLDGREIHAKTGAKGLSIPVPPGRHDWELTHLAPRLRRPHIRAVNNDAEGATVHIAPLAGVNQWLAEISADAGETWSIHSRPISPRFRVEGAPGSRIWVRATALRGRELSAPSEPFPIAFSDQPPAPPGLLQIQLTDGAALLRWSAVLGAAHYRLYRRAPGGEWQELYAGPRREFADSAEGLVAPFDPPGLRAAATRDMSEAVLYEYAVAAENDNGESPRSASVVADPR